MPRPSPTRSPVPPRSPFSASFLPPTPRRNRFASAEPSPPIRPTSSYSTASIRRVTPSPEMEITDAMKEKARGFARESATGLLEASPCLTGGAVGAGETTGVGQGLAATEEKEMARPEAPTPNAAAAAPYLLRPQSSGSWLGHSRSRHQLYSTENASTATLNNKESFKNLLATGSAAGDSAAAAPVIVSASNDSGQQYLLNTRSTQRLHYGEGVGVRYRLSLREGSKRIKRAGNGNGNSGGGYADFGVEEYERPETPTPVSERERRMMFRPLYIRGRARAEVGDSLTVQQGFEEKRGGGGGGKGTEGVSKGEAHRDNKRTGEHLREADGNADHETPGKTFINKDTNSNTITDEVGSHRDGGEARKRDLDLKNVTCRRPGGRTNRRMNMMELDDCVSVNERSRERENGDEEMNKGDEKKDKKDGDGEAMHNGRISRGKHEEDDEQDHGSGNGNGDSNRSGTAKNREKNGGITAKKEKNKKQVPKRRGSWEEQQRRIIRGKDGDEGDREPGCKVRCIVM